MSEKQIRWVSTIALVFVVTGVAIWLGEDLSSTLTVEVFVLVLGSALLGYLAAPLPSLASRICVASMIVICVVGGWSVGRTSATSAFNDCVARGETIRVLLGKFWAEHGEFPKSLEQLAFRDIPGKRWLRGPLLAYQRKPGGYELSFSDWLVTHRATETGAFVAWK